MAPGRWASPIRSRIGARLWFAVDHREILDVVRVLIVEDEPKLATLLRKGLTAQGLAADVATDGDEAMWMATATAYDAITWM